MGRGGVLLVALMALPLPAQEARKPAPGTQDKADLPALLDSWYKVTQNDGHAGFVHWSLERTTGVSWKYNYMFQFEADIMVKDLRDSSKENLSMESILERGELEDTYQPRQLSVSATMNGLDITAILENTDSGRQVVVTLPNGERKAIALRFDEDAHYSIFLMMISMRQNGQLTRPGPRKARLFFPRPTGSPEVEVEFEVGELSRRELLDKKEVPVTRITFQKPPPPSVREMELVEMVVDKYGRTVEVVFKGGVKLTLVKGEEEAAGKGRLSLQGRRDPFRKDLVVGDKPKVEVTGPKPPPLAQVVTPDKLQQHLTDAEKQLPELKKAYEKPDLEEAELIYQKILGYYIALRPLALKEQPALLSRVDDLKRKADVVYGAPRRVRNQAFAMYEEAMKAFGREACDEMEKKVVELRKVKEDPILMNTEELLEVSRWISDIEPKVSKCKTRLDLARKRLSLTGTVLQYLEEPQSVDLSINVFGHHVGARHEVRFIKTTYIAVINEKEYMVGDVVEGEGVKVEKIWNGGVTVSLKEEMRDIGLRQ